MKARALLAILTNVALVVAVSMQDMRTASAAAASEEAIHAVAKAELHAAVLASSSEAADARESIRSFLERPDVGTHIERTGLAPERISLGLALLSDSELLRLQAQAMAADEQMRTSGVLGWVIGVITLAVVLALTIILLQAYYGD